MRGAPVHDHLERAGALAPRLHAHRRRRSARARARCRTRSRVPRSAPATSSEPTSSSAVNSISTPDASSRRGDGVDRPARCRPSCRTPRPGGTAVGDGERARRANVPEREDGVVVAEQEHPRLAAARPVHVRAVGPVDERGRPTRARPRSARATRLGRRRERRRRRATATRCSRALRSASISSEIDHGRPRSCRRPAPSTRGANGTWRAPGAVCSTGRWTIARARRVPAPRCGDRPSRSACPRRGRRTPGLRREEVAMLAGVSVTWYTWLEQGRRINASPDVLRRSAGRCGSTRPASDHLLALAQPGRPSPVAPPPTTAPTRAGAPDHVDGAGAGVRARPALGVPRVEHRRGAPVSPHRTSSTASSGTCCGCCSPTRTRGS